MEQKLGFKGKMVKIDENTNLTIIDESINRLLKRLEVDVHIEHTFSGTPSRTMLRNIVARIYGVSEDLVIVRNVTSEYGIGISKAHIHIYADSGQLKRIEHKHILKRNGITA